MLNRLPTKNWKRVWDLLIMISHVTVQTWPWVQFGPLKCSDLFSHSRKQKGIVCCTIKSWTMWQKQTEYIFNPYHQSASFKTLSIQLYKHYFDLRKINIYLHVKIILRNLLPHNMVMATDSDGLKVGLEKSGNEWWTYQNLLPLRVKWTLHDQRQSAFEYELLKVSSWEGSSMPRFWARRGICLIAEGHGVEERKIWSHLTRQSYFYYENNYVLDITIFLT